jgi:hypothetical protein
MSESAARAAADLHRLHISYSRQDSELLVLVQSAVSNAGYRVTGILTQQDDKWFDAWHAEFKLARGVVVLFTRGNHGKLNNHGTGYKEKLAMRYPTQGSDAALFLEAAAIRKRKAEDPSFMVYVIDGEQYTASDVSLNLLKAAPSFGPVPEWEKFLDGGCVWNAPPKTDGSRVHEGAPVSLPREIDNWLVELKLQTQLALRQVLRDLDAQDPAELAGLTGDELAPLFEALPASLSKQRLNKALETFGIEDTGYTPPARASTCSQKKCIKKTTDVSGYCELHRAAEKVEAIEAKQQAERREAEEKKAHPSSSSSSGSAGGSYEPGSLARSCQVPRCEETFRYGNAFCHYHQNVQIFPCNEITGYKIGEFLEWYRGDGSILGKGYILAMEADSKNPGVMQGPGQIFVLREEESPDVNTIVSFYREHNPKLATHAQAAKLLKEHKTLSSISKAMMKKYGYALDGTKANPKPPSWMQF